MTIAGVMPPEFIFPPVASVNPAQVWLAGNSATAGLVGSLSPDILLARLQNGIALAQVRGQLWSWPPPGSPPGARPVWIRWTLCDTIDALAGAVD